MNKEKIDVMIRHLDYKFKKLFIKLEKNKKLTAKEKNTCMFTIIAIYFSRFCVAFNKEGEFDMKKSIKIFSSLREDICNYTKNYLLQIEHKLNEKK